MYRYVVDYDWAMMSSPTDGSDCQNLAHEDVEWLSANALDNLCCEIGSGTPMVGQSSTRAHEIIVDSMGIVIQRLRIQFTVQALEPLISPSCIVPCVIGQHRKFSFSETNLRSMLIQSLSR